MPRSPVVVAALAACLGAGCLDPGGPGLLARDQRPPEVLQTLPAVDERFPRDGTLAITFNEALDPRSVRPGLAVVQGGGEVPLTLLLPPPSEDATDTGRPYTVTGRPTDGAFAADGEYQLVLRTLLTDLAGNPLPAEQRIRFFTVAAP